MANLLGEVDRTTVLAYLGRPSFQSRQRLDQEVMYRRSGTIVNKTHTFIHSLPAKKGYIETFGLGYCYQVKNEWFIHWDHTEQLTLPNNESSIENESKEDFSLTKIQPVNISPIQRVECEKPCGASLDTIDKENNNNVSKGERNLGFAVNTAKRNILGQFSNKEIEP